MERVTKAELINLIETGHVNLYLGTFEVAGEIRAFYRRYQGAVGMTFGFKIIYIVV